MDYAARWYKFPPSAFSRRYQHRAEYDLMGDAHMARPSQYDAERTDGSNIECASAQRPSFATQLRKTLNTIPAYTWYAVPSGTLTFVNERYADYLGLAKNDPLRFGVEINVPWDTHIQLVHPDDHDETLRVGATCNRTGTAGQAAFRIRNAEGEYRWFLSRLEPLRASDGTLLYWIGINLDIDDRKRAEEALRRSEHLQAEAQRLSHTGSIGWNISSDEHFWSEETFRIFEFDPSSRVSVPMILERVHPQDRPAVKMALDAAAIGTDIDFECRLQFPDQKIKYLHVVGKAERDSAGSTEVIGAVMDITARKLAEVEFRRSKAHLADAQRLSHTGSAGMEAGTKRMFWSEESARIYGYAPGTEPTPELVLQRVHPDDVELLKSVLERAGQAGSDFNFEHRLLMPDGSTKHILSLAHGLRDGDGNEESVGAIMDITERKEAEQRLKQQETELRQVVDLAPQLIAVFGPDRERLYLNQMSLDYFGMTLDRWRETSPSNEVHPDDTERLQSQWARAIASGSAFEIEFRLRRSDGVYRWFLSRHNPVRDDQGKVLRWYASCADIEDRKRAEESLQRENSALREELNQASMFEEIVGSSEPLRKVLSQIGKVAPSDSTVLILGQTGTGKELIARAIHKRSKRAARAFVGVNCGAIPTSLIASELFGHEKGAFTGATQRRLGRFEAANGGTIFLDEVGDLPPDIQIALLRVLQEREIERVGSDRPVPVDVRVLAATHRDLDALVSEGKFRQDLLYRLNVVPITMPPLRERAADIPILVEYFIARFGKKMGKRFQTIENKTLKMMQEYEWPGNVRELQNVIERAVTLSDSDTFSVDDAWLKREPSKVSPSSVALNSLLLAHEKDVIEAALAQSHGRISGPAGAATKLGVPDSTLEAKIKRLGINKYRFKSQAG
jgi:PAS domain S-box-containing protein